ncbi:MAG: MFS transporter [Bacteroidota bacterium]|nr:MFS transporter [Bacteroidota bacterium]MDP4232765.1 MFS transporter [Bacteroidota bacterium]MDP4242553.1 MFS transporter [Bacteroidota bacterium]MDP4289370.1 MFS transporter [Bacteroidota bacterium]
MEVLTPSSVGAKHRPVLRQLFSAAVIVSALGYFVDIYDLVLFSIIRVPSLKSLGLSGATLLDTGIYLLNVQMVGMLIGGIAWGILGDKKGRLSVLFGSIILYSIANIANGFVQTVEQYAVLRFIAGLGLAGELGAGITLVSELLPKEYRGYGTALITSVGVAGAMLAWFIAKSFGWQSCFWIGGGLGLLLLILRIGILESGMYKKISHLEVRRGQFLSLFTNRHRFAKYVRCILIGLPTWYLVGILMTLAPELSKALGVTGEITGGESIFWFYLGLTIGNMLSGTISQMMRSRKQVVLMFLVATAVFVGAYFLQRGSSPEVFYAICTIMGVSSGYWALFVTVAAEQFGTNLRATVATTVPNFVRGALVPIALIFQWLKSKFAASYPAGDALIFSGIVLGAVTLAIAIYALSGLSETFGKDLDYIET